MKNKTNPLRKYWKSLSLGLMIIILCLLPASELAKFDVSITYGDIIIHFLMFMAFSVVLVLDTTHWSKALPRISLLMVLTVSTLLGILTESAQHWLSFLNRTGSWYDLLFDFLGTLAGLLLLSAIKRKSSPGI